jgi:hypothetical protein
MTLPLSRADFDFSFIGVDQTHGRFGKVHIDTCNHCSRLWLTYEVEYPAFTKSGRWYSGIVPPSVAKIVTPETAVEILEGLDWYLYGGDYFETSGRRGSGTVYV